MAQNNDDADARGEHKYRSERRRERLPKTTAEELLEQRPPGSYVAGAHGTHAVPQAAREKPNEKTKTRRRRA
jgi:hypothetical protein